MISTFRQTRIIQVIGVFLAFGVLSAYVFAYQLEPFSDFWNSFALDGLTALAALACAVPVMLVVRCYEPDEPLRKVWVNFAIGIWLWFAAELAWMYIDLFVEEIPTYSAADVFWLAGYIFFSLALLSQFKIVFQNLAKARIFFLGVWFGVIVLTFISVYLLVLTGFIAPESFYEKTVMYFYPFADFAVALFAIILVRVFRRGSLARPWLSMLVFVVADTLYVIANETGAYGGTHLNSELLSGYFRLLVDSLYMIAYLILAWGILSQYTLLKFGAGMFVGERQITRPLKPSE